MRDLGAVLDHEEPCPIRWKIRHNEMPATPPGDIAERGGARRGLGRRPAKFERGAALGLKAHIKEPFT